MKKRVGRAAVFFLLLFVFCIPVWARAGGGGGGGGSGGGSSGGSSSGSYGSSSHRSSGRDNIFNLLFQGGLFLIVTSGGSILLVLKARKAKARSRRAMACFAQLGDNWDAEEIQRQVEEAYFQVQECWRRMEVEYGAPYLSPKLQEEFGTKLQWMEIRGEEVVQKNVKLLSAMPVSVQDEPGEEQDVIWYLIHGKMTGYYIDKRTRQIIRGNKKPEAFFEYWKFIYRNKRWVLHEIRQQNEVDIDTFTM